MAETFSEIPAERAMGKVMVKNELNLTSVFFFLLMILAVPALAGKLQQLTRSSPRRLNRGSVTGRLLRKWTTRITLFDADVDQLCSDCLNHEDIKMGDTA